MSLLKVQLEIIINLLSKIFLKRNWKAKKSQKSNDNMLSIMKTVNNNPDCWAEIIYVVFLNINYADIHCNPLMRDFHTFLI